MPNRLDIVAENSDYLLDAGQYGAGALIRLEWSATEGGAYANVSGTGSTPTIALLAGVRTYTGYDPNGASTTWYRTRYENVGATRVSAYSDPFQASATSTDLCTEGQVKARLMVAGPSDTLDDFLIREMITQTSAWIGSYTGRILYPEDARTYIFDTVDGYVLRVPRGIRSITSMGVASTHQPDTGGAYTNVPVTDTLLRPRTVDLPRGWPATEVRISRGVLSGTIARFYRADNGCTITGDFGYDAVPDDIQAIAIDATVAAYQSRKNGVSSVIGAEDSAIPPWSRFFGRGSPQRMTLDRYRYMTV